MPNPPRRRRLSRSAAPWLLLATLSGCAVERPGDILLLTVDTLRADHLGLYGYPRSTTPRLDVFFADGLVIERAYATEANTSPSVVSVLSGLLPQEHRVRLLYQLVPAETDLVVDLLPDAYQTAAFVSNIVLTDEALGVADRFDHYDDRVDQVVGEPGQPHPLYERDARATTEAALRWLAIERDPNRPLFLWVHYIDPHGPYTPPADAPRTFDHEGSVPIEPVRVPSSVRKEGVEDALVYVDHYDAEIAHTDAEIGRLLDGYAAGAPIDDALVVFTADHGEALLERAFWFAHGFHVFEELVRVPLMLRGPGVPTGRVSGLASGIDVAPTLLRFAGVRPPPEVRGVDLRSGRIPEDRTVFSEATSPLGLFVRGHEKSHVGFWRAAIRGPDKWTVGQVRGQRAVQEPRFYDLDSDPMEQSPRPSDLDTDPGRALLGLIERDPDPGGRPEQLERGIRLDAPKVAPRASEAQRERLRALGYVE